MMNPETIRANCAQLAALWETDQMSAMDRALLEALELRSARLSRQDRQILKPLVPMKERARVLATLLACEPKEAGWIALAEAIEMRQTWYALIPEETRDRQGNLIR